MADGALEPDVRKRLHEAEKVLMEDIKWEQREDDPIQLSMKANVRTVETGEVLVLHGEYYRKGHSFALRYQNGIVRRFDFSDHWEGMDGHKHKSMFASIGEDDPYAVDDVSTSNVNQAIIDFLAEENIRTGECVINEKPDLSDYE